MGILDELFRYQDLIHKITDQFKQFKGAKAGETVTIPRTVVDVGGERWELAEHTATRLR